MDIFWEGFEKQANAEAALAAGAVGAGLAGLGALSGHASHVGKKLDNARSGKDYKEKTFIDRHPKTTGALSLGIAPAISRMMQKRKADRENPKVRKVLNDHPFMSQNHGVGAM